MGKPRRRKKPKKGSPQYKRNAHREVLYLWFQRNCIWCFSEMWCPSPHQLDGERRGRPRATIEHMLPTSHGGGDDLDNLVLACESCNNKRGNMSVIEFFFSPWCSKKRELILQAKNINVCALPYLAEDVIGTLKPELAA